MPTKDNQIQTFLFVITILILLLACFITFVLFLYKRKQTTFLTYLETLKRNYEKDLLTSQLEVQEQTLQHVAAEIHDNIGMTLTLAKLNLNTIDQAHTNPAITLKLNNAIKQVSQALGDLSHLSKTLNYNHIAHEGLVKALNLEVAKIKSLGLHKLQFEVQGKPVFLDGQKELIIFRIVQEALQNSIRHANASFLSLQLKYDETHLHVQVHDDGTGFTKEPKNKEVEQTGGSGLKNMQQRSKLINGECKIENAFPNGTTVYLNIPI